MAMIGREDFHYFWQENYTGLLPLGHVLKEHFSKDRWFRIHSLPSRGGKVI
jgi:hypothetical protein